MATQVQLRGGTTSEHSSFTGAAREVTVDTDKDVVVVHDGSTAGGIPLAKEASVLPLAGGTMTGDVSLGDNVKAKFGAGNDLQIYHNAYNSYISEAGTGALNIQGAELVLEHPDGTNYFRAASDGSVRLYNGGALKLATTSTGIDVTGTASMDGLTVDSDKDTTAITIQTPYGGAGEAYSALRWNNSSFAGGDSEIRNVVNGAGSIGSSLEFHTEQTGTGTLTERLKLHNNGDISFYEDTGTTPKFFWDASAESLGIGTSSPNSELVVIGNIRTGSNTTPTSTIQNGTVLKSTQVLSTAGQSGGRGGAVELGGFYDNGVTTTTIFGAVAGLKEADASGVESGYLSLQTNSAGTIAERLRIDSAGDVGIGTTTPAAKLDVNGTLACDGFTSTGIDDNATSTAITIDASENVRVDGSYVQIVNTAPSLYLSNGTVQWQMQNTSGNDIVFNNGATEKVRFPYAGGITFNGDTAAANALDDYEEGTWTPTIGIGTINTINAKYTKIGNTVTAWFYATSFSDRSSSNNVYIGGLPFTSASTMGYSGCGSIMSRHTDSFANQAYINGNTDYINFYGNTTGNWDILKHNDLNNSASAIYGSVTYHI